MQNIGGNAFVLSSICAFFILFFTFRHNFVPKLQTDLGFGDSLTTRFTGGFDCLKMKNFLCSER